MQVDAQFLARHVDYTRWATHKIVEACAPLGREELTRQMYTSHGSLLGTLVHIYQADTVWLLRLQGNPLARGPEPPADLDALRAVWFPVLDAMYDFAAALTPERIEEPVAFQTASRGDGARPMWQVILQVVNHATYHRGQAATLLRQLAHTAPPTDLIHKE